MYPVSEAYNTAAKAISRRIKSRVTFNDSVILDGSRLMNMDYKSSAESTSDVGIGSVCAASVKIQFFMPETPIPLSEAKVVPEVGYELEDGSIEYAPLGVFRVSDYSSSDGYKTISVTAYDALGECGVPYSPKVGFPTTISQFLADVLSQCGVTMSDSVVLPDYQISEPYEGDCKQQIGWVAGLLGKNAKMDRSGKLIFTWYNASDYTIDRSCQKMGGFTRSAEEAFVVNSLLIGQTESQFSYGSGEGVVHPNPYVTEEIGQAVFNAIQGTSFYPCKINWRGNPAVDVGDLLLVETTPGVTVPVAIMSHTMKITGGLSSTVECFAKTDKQRTLTRKPSDIKLEQMYDNVLGAFAAATDKIIGAKGGYFKLTYDDLGFPTGWTISDTPTIQDNTRMWIMSSGGLGYSTDGGKTISKIGITMDGEINGELLTIGSVSQDAVEGLAVAFQVLEDGIYSSVSSTYATKEDLEGLEEVQMEQKTAIEQLSDSVNITIQEKVTELNGKIDGINSITTSTGYTFDADGLRISKDNQEIENKITNEGMYVTRDDVPILTANSDGVKALNLTAEQYLIVGKNSRFEDYTGDSGEARTGCFWIGG